jgi:hypothetical protein
MLSVEENVFVFTAEVNFTPGDASLDVQRATYTLEGSIKLKEADGQQLIYTEATTLPMCQACLAPRKKVPGVRGCDQLQLDRAQLLQSPIGEDRTETVPVSTTIYLHGAGGWPDGEWPPMLPCARPSTTKIPVTTRPFSY